MASRETPADFEPNGGMPCGGDAFRCINRYCGQRNHSVHGPDLCKLCLKAQSNGGRCGGSMAYKPDLFMGLAAV